MVLPAIFHALSVVALVLAMYGACSAPFLTFTWLEVLCFR